MRSRTGWIGKYGCNSEDPRGQTPQRVFSPIRGSHCRIRIVQELLFVVVCCLAKSVIYYVQGTLFLFIISQCEVRSS